MARGYAIGTALLVFALGAGCRSGPAYTMGESADAEVTRVLHAPPEGEAALSTGSTFYLLPAGELMDQRTKLIEALRAAAVISVGTPLPAPVPEKRKNESGVVSLQRPQVFEGLYPDGTLHVERVPGSDEASQYYAVSFFGTNRVPIMRVKSSAGIEGAWRALFDAARRVASESYFVGPMPGYRDRILESLRDSFFDLCGIEPE